MANHQNPKIVTELTYEGATIVWKNTPTDDRAPFVETIEEYVESLKGDYRVRLDLDDDDEMHLHLNFKGESSPTDRQIMKGIVGMIIGDTIWGGGSR